MGVPIQEGVCLFNSVYDHLINKHYKLTNYYKSFYISLLNYNHSYVIYNYA